MWVEDASKGYRVATRHLYGVQVPYKGMRQVQDTYKGYKVGTRHLQGVRCRYEIPTRV